MSIDAERLRNIALARHAIDSEKSQEAAKCALAVFRSETLAAFSEWLNEQLEQKAQEGLLSITLRFDRWEPRPCEWSAFLYQDCEEEDFTVPLRTEENTFLVGSQSLPIDPVIGCVIELMRKVGIKATSVGSGPDCCPEVELSW